MAKTSWFSVDGQNVYELDFDAVVDLAVLATGCEVRAQGTSTVLATWTYSGSNRFLGLANSSGSSTPDNSRAVGDTASLSGLGVTNFYSVASAIPVPYLTTDQELASVADAIRAKGATSALLVYPNGFVSAINAIPTGGGANLETGSQTITATESSQSITMTPSAGYDGFDEVNISVNAIPSNYVGSGVTQRTSSDLTASGATVTAPAGYYASAASKAVASGTAGTPTATKGTVSSHSVTVTPSVTNTAGYIPGGTKTGTAVRVSASELVSGTYSVTGSGTKDVTNYASITVPSGSATTPATTITANPTISVSSTGLITASVSGSQSVTPSVSAGYVSSGTAGTVSVSGSNTSQLTTQAAQTITPTTSDQTIASGKYLTGTQTIKGDANLVAANIADGVTIFGVTGTHQGGGGGSVTTVAFGDDAMFVGDEIGYVDGSGVFHDGLSYLAIMSAVSYQMLTGSIVIRSSAMGDPDMSGEVLNLPSTLTQIARWTVMNKPTPKYLFIYQVG